MVLKRAGLAEHDWVLALTSDDEVNLAVVRFAGESGVKNVVARCLYPEHRTALEEAGARTFSGIAVMAAEIAQYLRNPRVRVVPVARGRGEVLEMEVAAGSGMEGKTLEELASGRWQVAAVFRGERMLLHSPELVVLERDILIVVAEPDSFEDVCEWAECSQLNFPQAYGHDILAVLPEDGDGQRAVLNEAMHLAQGTMVGKVTLVADAEAAPVRDGRALWSQSVEIVIVPAESRPYAQLESLCSEGKSAIAVVPWTEPSILKTLTRRTPLKLAHSLSCPLLVARGVSDYKRILVPFTGSKPSELALDTALQMGTRFGARVAVALVREPEFLHGSEDDWVPAALTMARELAQARSQSLEELMLEGNPVHRIVEAARDFDLIVLGSGESDGAGLLNPDVGSNIVDRSPCSVLVVKP